MPETNPINSIAALSWAKHTKAPSYLFKLDNEKTIYVDGVKQELSEQNSSFRKKVDLIIEASEQLLRNIISGQVIPSIAQINGELNFTGSRESVFQFCNLLRELRDSHAAN